MFISFPVVGLGFGMMSGVFSLVNVLADSVGPGTVGFNDEPQDFFMISSLLCMAMILLHTFWGVIAFDAWDQRKWLNLIYVWASHLTVSCLVSIPLFCLLFLRKRGEIWYPIIQSIDQYKIELLVFQHAFKILKYNPKYLINEAIYAFSDLVE